MWFYNWEAKRCDVFSWSCSKHRNKFSTYDDCWKTCSEQNTMLTNLGPNRRRGKKGRNRNRNNENSEDTEENENNENSE